MIRPAKVLVLVVWVVGAFIGGLTVQPSPNPSADESWTLLVDTDYMNLGVTHTQAVLVVTTPWQSEWRAVAPLPDRRNRSRSEEAASAPPSEAPVAKTIVAFFLRSLVPLP
jgi:hypothetical protein